MTTLTTLGKVIPRIIHQTYKSIEQLPEHWQDTPLSWKAYNKNWQYIFWSDKDCLDLVAKSFPQYLDCYERLKYNIQRADMIRYMFLYTHGGFYADCDIKCKKSLEDFPAHDGDVQLIRTSNTYSITNCIMASKPGNEFWLKVLEEIKNRVENPSVLWVGKHWYVMQTTGPMMLNTMYYKYKDQYDIQLLTRELFLPDCCSTCSEKPCTTDEAYTQLVDGSSWVNFDTQIYNFFLCNYRYVLVIIGLCLVIYLTYRKQGII